uniref:Uncharacterized protein n=1 Tax=Cryptomonas curvata TaxID=233186 RepID=A0A7S0MGD7_9CRYP|mmetsp:Transcript_36562/g.76360  ORF Transcript_36562/g.76360 Transcript_36562/m.76360 type:complete len:102 (+) Transcript_36562:118-423(+)
MELALLEAGGVDRVCWLNACAQDFGSWSRLPITKLLPYSFIFVCQDDKAWHTSDRPRNLNSLYPHALGIGRCAIQHVCSSDSKVSCQTLGNHLLFAGIHQI